jgi:hypothetical protein
LQTHDCARPGCHDRVIGVPILLIPTHPLSINKGYAGMRCPLWIPLCARHMNQITLHDVLSEQALGRMEDGIRRDFAANNAVPDFSKTEFVRAPVTSIEFKRLAEMAARARQN